MSESASSWKVSLATPAPHDPRERLPNLAAATEAYKRKNDRLELGLRIGFRELERVKGSTRMGQQ